MGNFYGQAGSDTISALGDDDFYISGYAGNDSLSGGSGAAEYGMLDGGEGDDELYGEAKTLYTYGGAGDDFFASVADTLFEYGGIGDDFFAPLVRAYGQIYGDAGNDKFVVSTDFGTLQLYGGDGNDFMAGLGGLIMDPGAGMDTVKATPNGGDQYLFGKGDGADVLMFLNRVNAPAVGKVFDEIRFKSGVAPEEVWVQYDETGEQLEIVVGVGGLDRIALHTGSSTLFDAINSPYSINRITFADAPNVIWSKSDLLSRRAPSALGTDASQRLIGSKGNDTVDGRGGDDLIYGIDGNDMLIGGLGSDLLDGGLGDDSLTGDAGRDTLIGGVGSDTLSGGAEGDHLNGGLDNDLLYGGAGNDILNGDAGSDIMVGGEGDDVYYVDNSTDTIIEEVGQGLDEAYATTSYILPAYVEYGELAGTANLNLTGHDQGAQLWGNAGSNRITGGKGADELSGGFGGLDTMIGGAADDRYYVLNQTDALVEKAGEGFDEAWALISGYRLADNVESLRLLSNMSVGYGNGGDNVISGNGARNALYGLGGDDLIMGYGGNDTLTGGLGNDILSGGTGDDGYVYSVGDGEDEIMNYDVKGVDTLMIHGATESQVWFESSGKDLYISIVGQEGGVSINRWNLGSAYQVDLIKLDNGKTLSAGSVANLVNAMSSFTPPAIGQTTLPTNYQAALGVTIAQNWVA